MFLIYRPALACANSSVRASSGSRSLGFFPSAYWLKMRVVCVESIMSSMFLVLAVLPVCSSFASSLPIINASDIAGSIM